MRILISFSTLCVVILTFAFVAGAQTKKAKAKSTSAPARATTQGATTPPETGTNYIGETEKGNGKTGNKAVFEPNDEPKGPDGQPATPGRGSGGQIMDTFDPGARTKPKASQQTPVRSNSTPPPLPDVIVSSKTAPPSTGSKKTAKPKASTTKRKP